MRVIYVLMVCLYTFVPAGASASLSMEEPSASPVVPGGRTNEVRVLIEPIPIFVSMKEVCKASAATYQEYAPLIDELHEQWISTMEWVENLVSFVYPSSTLSLKSFSLCP